MTGATGFLGSRIARALLERGETVRLLHRAGRAHALEPAVPAGAGARAEPVEGDVTDAASLRTALSGCRAVVHAAARVSRSGTWEDFEAVNVGGVRTAIEEAEAAGAERILVTSSFFALAPTSSGEERGADESALDVAVEALDHYQASKRAGALLAREARRRGAPVVTLFPGAIVGPGPSTEGNFVSAMIRDHLRGRPIPLPCGGRPAWSFVHVDDVATGHLAALDSTSPSEAYCLGGTNVGLARVFEDVEALTGRRPPRMSVPYPLLWAVGLGEEALEHLVGRAPRDLTRGAARLLRRGWALDSGRAERELGWSFRPLRELLVETIAWMEGEGLVPSGTLRRRAEAPA